MVHDFLPSDYSLFFNLVLATTLVDERHFFLTIILVATEGWR